MKHLIIYSILVLILCACEQTTHYVPNEIILDHFAANSKETSIDEIVTHIDYIQLETTPESLISRVDKIQIKDDKIYVLDEGNYSLLMFDILGKFIRKIGNRGNGPGEYVGICDLALCDSVVLIMDHMQAKMILYDTLGNLIAEKFIANNPPKIAFYKSMPTCQYNYPKFVYNKGYRISIYDRNLNLAENVLKSGLQMNETSARQIRGTHAISFFANVSDTLTFWEAREDVVYKVIDENTIISKYKFQYKNQAKPEDGMFEVKEGSNEINRMQETRDYIFMTGFYKGKPRRLIYFKNNNEGISVEGELKNSKGPNFFPYYVTEDGRAYKAFSVFAYKAELEENEASIDNLDLKLQSLLHTANFDDNPCIMLVTLK